MQKDALCETENQGCRTIYSTDNIIVRFYVLPVVLVRHYFIKIYIRGTTSTGTGIRTLHQKRL